MCGEDHDLVRCGLVDTVGGDGEHGVALNTELLLGIGLAALHLIAHRLGITGRANQVRIGNGRRPPPVPECLLVSGVLWILTR